MGSPKAARCWRPASEHPRGFACYPLPIIYIRKCVSWSTRHYHLSPTANASRKNFHTDQSSGPQGWNSLQQIKSPFDDL